MGKGRKNIKYDDISTREGHFNAMHDKSVYKVGYSAGKMKQLASKIIAESMLSQVDSEGCHCKVLADMTGHRTGDSAITNVDVFIIHSHGNIHLNRKIHS